MGRKAPDFAKAVDAIARVKESRSAKAGLKAHTRGGDGGNCDAGGLGGETLDPGDDSHLGRKTVVNLGGYQLSGGKKNQELQKHG